MSVSSSSSSFFRNVKNTASMVGLTVLVFATLVTIVRAEECPTTGIGSWADWSVWNDATENGTRYRLRFCTPPIVSGCVISKFSCEGNATERNVLTSLNLTTPATSEEVQVEEETDVPVAAADAEINNQVTTVAPTTNEEVETTTLPTPGVVVGTIRAAKQPLTTCTGTWSSWSCVCCGACANPQCSRKCQASSTSCKRGFCDGAVTQQDNSTTCSSDDTTACKFPLPRCCSGTIAYADYSTSSIQCRNHTIDEL